MKRNLHYTGFALLLVLGITACSKELPEIPVSNNPVFQLSGNFNGESISLIAGDNNAYMHTMTENMNGVDFYAGQITDGSTSIKLGVFNGNIDMPNVEAEDVLAGLSTGFAVEQTLPLATLSKYSFPSYQAIEEIEWFINGVSNGTGEVQITEPGHYEVCAMISFLDQSSTTLCNDLILGYAIHSNFSIEYDFGLQQQLTASIDEMGNAVSSVKWFCDGVQISTNNSLQHSMASTPSAIIEAEVTFSSGVVRRKAIYVSSYNPDNCVRDFTHFEIDAVASYMQDYKFLLEVERNGVTYSSLGADNSMSEIQILGCEYFGKNTAGKEVYKIEISVSANVKEQGGSTILPLNFSSTFGIEID